MPYIARVLGPEKLGIYSYVHSVSYYFVLFAMLGFLKYGSRKVAEIRDDPQILSCQVSSIWGLQIITTIFALIGYVFYFFLFEVQYLELFALETIYVVSAVFDLSWFYCGIEKFKKIVIRNIFIKIISLLFMISIVHTEQDVNKYVLIIALSTLIGNASFLWGISENVKLVIPTMKDIFTHLRPCSLLFVSVLAISFYKVMDKILVAQLSNVNELAYFSNAEQLVGVQLIVSTSIGSVMLPHISHLVSQNKKEECHRLLENTFVISMFVVSAFSFGIVGVSRDFVPMFLGDGFSETSVCLEILAMSGLFLAWAEIIRTQYLIPNHLDGVYIRSLVYAAIINFVLNIVVIGEYGAFGASWVLLCTEAYICLYQTYYVSDLLPVKYYFLRILPAIVIGVVMCGCVRMCSYWGTSFVFKIFLEIFIGFLIYTVLTLVYFKYAEKEYFERIKFYIVSIKSKLVL